MKTLIISLLLATLGAEAQTIVKGSVNRTVAINGRPSFFFKVHGSGNFISYTIAKNASNPGSEGINHLVDVRSNADIILPGPWDPVFVAGTEFMVLPQTANPGNMVYELRDLNELLVSNYNSFLSFIPGVKGLYQSVGVLKDDGVVMQGRLMAEDGYQDHAVQDFSYNRNAKTIEFAHSSFKRICPNVKIKLPMLSKDGQYLGGRDVAAKKSAIWKINANYSCTKVKEFPANTGKLNFNYNSTKATYHIYNQAVTAANTDDQSNDYIPLPSDNYVSDIFVVDLISGATTRVTANREANSMYPDFTEDGRLVFINHPHDDYKNVTFTFLKL